MTARRISALLHRRFILGAALLVAGQAQAGTLTFGDIGSWNTPYEEWEEAVNAFKPTAEVCFANQQAPLVARLRFAMGASGKATAVNDITDTIGAAGFERLKDPKVASCLISAVSNYQWPRYASEEQDLEFFFTPRTSDVWTDLWKARPGDPRSSLRVPLAKVEGGATAASKLGTPFRGPDITICDVEFTTTYIFDDRDALSVAIMTYPAAVPLKATLAFNTCATEKLGNKPTSELATVYRWNESDRWGFGMKAKVVSEQDESSATATAPTASRTTPSQNPSDDYLHRQELTAILFDQASTWEMNHLWVNLGSSLAELNAHTKLHLLGMRASPTGSGATLACYAGEEMTMDGPTGSYRQATMYCFDRTLKHLEVAAFGFRNGTYADILQSLEMNYGPSKAGVWSEEAVTVTLRSEPLSLVIAATDARAGGWSDSPVSPRSETSPSKAPPTGSGMGTAQASAVAGQPSAALGHPDIMGGLDQTQIEKVMQKGLAQLGYCYQRELTKNPALAGTIVVKFVVARDGTVSTASTKTTTMNNSTVESCVKGHVLGYQFPPPLGGMAMASYPLIFRPEAEGTPEEGPDPEIGGE